MIYYTMHIAYSHNRKSTALRRFRKMPVISIFLFFSRILFIHRKLYSIFIAAGRLATHISLSALHFLFGCRVILSYTQRYVIYYTIYIIGAYYTYRHGTLPVGWLHYIIFFKLIYHTDPPPVSFVRACETLRSALKQPFRGSFCLPKKKEN